MRACTRACAHTHTLFLPVSLTPTPAHTHYTLCNYMYVSIHNLYQTDRKIERERETERESDRERERDRE